MNAFAINTLGCKVNQYESQQIRELLEQMGLTMVLTADSPDFVIINTCCVTKSASAKSRQYIRKAQKLNPEAEIIICGCLTTAQLDELNDIGGKVHLIDNRRCLAGRLKKIIKNKITEQRTHTYQTHQPKNIKTEIPSKIKRKNDLDGIYELPLLTCFKGRTRAFVKIQDGCDAYCSYCIIPKTRPIVRSISAEKVLRQVKILVNAGHKEIVVTGVFLGAYGQDTTIRKRWSDGRVTKLAELLDKMAVITGLARIRLSSLEPADITERLIDTFCGHRNIMPHLHLSLQSGSDAILKKMRRQYDISEFKEKIDLIKSRLDRPAITTDIIVGFPGEREEDFQQTVALAKEVGFAKMHIFSFSPREGTSAAKMQDTVTNSVIKSRSAMLRKLGKRLGRDFREQFVGEPDVVLLENGRGRICGRSERYFMVSVEGDDFQCKKNALVEVKLVKNTPDGAVGEFIRMVD